MRSETVSRVALSIAAAGVVLSVVCWRTFFKDTLSSSFLSVALLSVLVIQVRTKFAPWEAGAVVGFGALFAVMDLKWLGYPARWQVWVSFLGMASLVVLALRVIWSEGEKRRTALYTWVPAFLFVTSEWCADYFLAWTERAQPKVLDLFLYSFDASLHVQIPFRMGQLFASSFPFLVTSLVFYLGLPLIIGLVFAGCLVRDKGNALPACLAFLLTGPVGAVFYNFLPALGPIHIFKQSFPWHPLSIDQASHLFLEPVAGQGARNAIPSLHAAWVFLALWYAWKLSAAERLVAALFVFFTLCAAVGLGEHYFVDLVVALPFSLFILAAANLLVQPNRRLLFPVVAGLSGTLLWFIALRYATQVFWITPVFPWSACLITLLITAYGLRDLRGFQPSIEMQPHTLEGVTSSVG